MFDLNPIHWVEDLYNKAKNAAVGDPHEYTPYQVDPSVGQYGDDPNAYSTEQTMLGDNYNAAIKRQATDYGNSQEDRMYQQHGMQNFQDVLNGKGLSIAQLQQQQGLQQSVNSGLNMAASARGGGGNQLAAMGMALRQSAAMGQDAVTQNALLRAKEQNDARAGYAAQANGMRAADNQSMGLNQQNSLGLMGAKQHATDAYDQQKLSLAQLQSGSYGTAQGLQQAQDKARDDRTTSLVKDVVSGGSGVAAKASQAG